MRKAIFLFIASLLWVAPSLTQSPNASINGLVLDPSGAAIAGAQIVVVNDSTGVQYTSKTNGEGIYVVTNVPPGTYRIQVSNSGFKTIIKPDIVIHVQDAVAMNFTLPIGAASEIVTVKGGTPLINTESAAVSTVVDQSYVTNMPLNGRSLQDLILLTPGVLTNSPQSKSVLGVGGEFSVNGQRTESNYYAVDGVSANAGIFPNAVTGASSLSGSLPSATVLGTTQGLVSVDALEEFRVQTSSYSAEYGRNQGGQFYFVTRSGTNQWHGTAFDYLRNDAFDANDWFNDYLAQRKPPLRQNDFGGTLGGPIEIPRLYHGKNSTFFFFSYEGLRLLQPQAATISDVPSVSLRSSARKVLQPVLNAFPIPNGRDLGNGLGEYVASWSNPGQIDSESVRLDHTVNDRLKLFFRFSNTASNSAVRTGGQFSDPANPTATSFTTRTYTFGATSSFSTRGGNEFRLGYISNDSASVSSSDNFGGAQPVNLGQLQGLDLQKTNPTVDVFFLLPNTTSPQVVDGPSKAVQRQWNLVDTASLVAGGHQFRFGADYRRSSPVAKGNDPFVAYFFSSQSSVLNDSVDLGQAIVQADARPVYTNFSLFVQDEWRVTGRLNLSLGLRWDVNPAPGAASGNLPYTVQGSSVSTLTLSPQGTPLWQTTWFNFAPRLGAVYVLRNTPGWETVVRGGGGVFFDTGQQLGSVGYQGPGFSSLNDFGIDFGTPAAFPISPARATPPIINPPVPPFTVNVWAFSPHLQLPFTLQWNASIEQALGKSQSLSASYVGANGRRLLEQSEVNVGQFNSNFRSVFFSENGLTSDYNALQVRYQRRLAQGLQALAAYTWSHSIDYGSLNISLPFVRGNSDFDVRHNFSAAFSFDFPNQSKAEHSLMALLFDYWGLDGRLSARSGFPVSLDGRQVADPVTGSFLFAGLNLVPGQPLYLYGSQCALAYNNGRGCPGGRAINPAAFVSPSGNSEGDAPRNFMRGFGAWQSDFAARRDFPIHERLKLQFRAEAFNVLNHPNFGSINARFCSLSPTCTFGQAQATLAKSLGVLSSLYQTGGPRSMQLALKLIF